MTEQYRPGRSRLPDWNNAQVEQINRLPEQAGLVPFPDQASCLAAISDNPRYLSSYLFHLDGQWDYRFYSSVLQLPDNILSFRSGFDSIGVPGPAAGNRKNQSGRGADRPFLLDWPHIPSDQPVLVYRRSLRLPLTWSGLRKRLVLQGFSAACHVYLNSRFVGYSEGSGLPASFDVTHHVHDGDNDLFIFIWPSCSSSYLEFSGTAAGLFRDVYLEAVPPISLYDLRVETTMDDEPGSWQLNVSLDLISYRIAMEQPRVQISLRDQDYRLLELASPVILKPLEQNNNRWPSPVQSTGNLQIEAPLHGIISWNHQQPYLYDLVISILDEKGREMACYRQAVGFRQIRQQADGVQINGEPLQLFAASWHDADFWQSKPQLSTMIRHLSWLKQHHLNALVLQELPVDPIFLELCDIYGVYIVAELPVYPPPLLAGRLLEQTDSRDIARRLARRLITRDYNHPSIIAWSAGRSAAEEQQKGQWAEYLTDLDSSRLWQEHDFTDLSAPLLSWLKQNQTAVRLPAWLTDPRSLGDIGLCLGQWLPAGISSSVLPALLDSDWRPHALLPALKHALQPLIMEAIDAPNGAFLLRSHLSGWPADHYKISWILLRNGYFYLSGELDIPSLPPGGEHFYEISYGKTDLNDGAEYRLRFEISLLDSCLWARYGFDAGSHEFLLAEPEELVSKNPKPGGHLRLDQDRHHLILSGSRFWVIFNTVLGCIESWRLGEAELLARGSRFQGIQPAFAQTPDLLSLPWQKAWQETGIDRLSRQVVAVQHSCDRQAALISCMEHLGLPGHLPLFALYTRYEINAQGQISIFINLTASPGQEQILLPFPPMYLHVPLRSVFQQATWQGKGPQAGLLAWQPNLHSGLYQQDAVKILEKVQPGLVFGDCRWLCCEDAEGLGLQMRSDQLFAFSLEKNKEPGLLRQPAALIWQLYMQTEQNIQPVKAIFDLQPVIRGR